MVAGYELSARKRILLQNDGGYLSAGIQKDAPFTLPPIEHDEPPGWVTKVVAGQYRRSDDDLGSRNSSVRLLQEGPWGSIQREMVHGNVLHGTVLVKLCGISLDLPEHLYHRSLLDREGLTLDVVTTQSTASLQLKRDDRVKGRFVVDDECQSRYVVVPSMVLEDAREARGCGQRVIGQGSLMCFMEFKLFSAPLRADLGRLDPEAETSIDVGPLANKNSVLESCVSFVLPGPAGDCKLSIEKIEIDRCLVGDPYLCDPSPPHSV